MKKIKTTTYHFPVIIEKDEDGYFVADVPAIPGCHTQGKTYEEVIERVKEVIALCLEVAKEDADYMAKIDFNPEDESSSIQMGDQHQYHSIQGRI